MTGFAWRPSRLLLDIVPRGKRGTLEAVAAALERPGDISGTV